MGSQNRDPEYLAKLRRYYAETRRIPSMARIGELMGFSAPAAQKFIERLAGEGFVTRTPDCDAWVPNQRFFERPLVEASVQAGNPVAVEAVPAEPFLIDEYVVREPAPLTFDDAEKARVEEQLKLNSPEELEKKAQEVLAKFGVDATSRANSALLLGRGAFAATQYMGTFGSRQASGSLDAAAIAASNVANI